MCFTTPSLVLGVFSHEKYNSVTGGAGETCVQIFHERENQEGVSVLYLDMSCVTYIFLVKMMPIQKMNDLPWAYDLLAAGGATK